MPVMHDFECQQGHTFELMVDPDQRWSKCPQCNRKAQRTFLSQTAKRFMRDPIVVFKHHDGAYGVPGRADAPTPAGAERIEIRSMQQYDSVMRDWNGKEQAKAARGLERHLEAREQMIAHNRRELASLMARTDDPLAKDLLREALERPTIKPHTNFRPFVNEAMEMNASNRDACFDGHTGHGRHK